MFEIEANKEYPTGTPINLEQHGPQSSSRFTIMTAGKTIISDCRFEGWGSLFSTPAGEIITNVNFFRLQLEDYL